MTIKQDKITHDGKGMNDEVSFVEIKLHSCQLHVLNLMAPDGLSFTSGDWGSDLCSGCGERGHTEPSLLVSQDRNNKEWSLYDWLYATLSATCAFDLQ